MNTSKFVSTLDCRGRIYGSAGHHVRRRNKRAQSARNPHLVHWSIRDGRFDRRIHTGHSLPLDSGRVYQLFRSYRHNHRYIPSTTVD